jgi:hypothetical protein
VCAEKQGAATRILTCMLPVPVPVSCCCAVVLLRRSGGIQGGISNGEDIVLRVAFKPTSTIGIKQQTVTRAGAAGEGQKA